MKNLLLLLVFVLPFYVAFGQGRPPLKFDRLGEKEGIISAVQAVMQDSQGFLWIGTAEGLYRYDGVKYRAFKHKAKDSTTIPEDNIVGIVQDQQGYLWIATFTKGIFRFDPRTFKVTQFADYKISGSINWLSIDSKNRLWIIAYGALYQLNIKQQQFHVYVAKDFPKDGKESGGGGIAEDKQGQLWYGLLRYDEKQNKFVQPEIQHKEWFEMRHSIAQDTQGRFWTGHSNGFSIFDPKKATVSKLDTGYTNKRSTAKLSKATLYAFAYIQSRNEMWYTYYNGVLSIHSNLVCIIIL